MARNRQKPQNVFCAGAKLEKLKVSMALRCTGGVRVVVSGSGMHPNLHCTHTMTLERGRKYLCQLCRRQYTSDGWLIDGFGILPQLPQLQRQISMSCPSNAGTLLEKKRVRKHVVGHCGCWMAGS